MTLREAREQNLEVFFLASEAEAQAFAETVKRATGRETGHFMELTRPAEHKLSAPLFVATVTPRAGVCKFTRRKP
jgi:hypothetical protein